jgi:hypothetical protein
MSLFLFQISKESAISILNFFETPMTLYVYITHDVNRIRTHILNLMDVIRDNY